MPAIRRNIKKGTYAGLFGIILVILIAFLILPQLKIWGQNIGDSGPLPELIKVESINAVRHGGSIDIVAQVRNPNPRDGVPDYTVTFVLLNESGDEIQRIPRDTYLLPGSLNYIAALDIELSSELDQVTVETTEQPVFNKLEESASPPSFTSFLRSRNLRKIGDQEFEVQKGIVTNRGTLGYKQVDVTGVAFNISGEVIGVSTTFIGEFKVGEQREFTLQWPAPSSETERVIVLPSANIYEEDNILEVSGDPDQLRDTPLEDEEDGSFNQQQGQLDEAADL